jgi:hypothetical protein
MKQPPPKMDQALKIMRENPVHSRRPGAPEPVLCVDTGETAYINEWAKAIAEQRGVKPHSVMAYMVRKIRQGNGQPVNCFGLNFMYEKDYVPETAAPGRGMSATRGYVRRPAPQQAVTTMHSRTK